ncbi:histidine protein methyltransferase 1 homolog isoform X2 [Phymastichus coffea]|uniref:histidine protein methyltransferase 1 homolog isoform X2 n=1 Tax=Phymastichus coffea TaxID=108790 RepID=UPI00273B2057|nr:histidine protein methyltransferase 1 homolog isoform X2 [Phymastichus coffea]
MMQETLTQGEEENKKCDENQLNWLPARKIAIPSNFFQKNSNKIEFTYNYKVPSFELKLVDSEKVIIKLKEEKYENIIEAESQHSDLLPAKYEGGLKIWECTYDLANFIILENFCFEDTRVLDLGCGAGIIGLIALLRGATIHFQDYNAEVIESVTIPNVILNCKNDDFIKKKCEFYCGDWQSFTDIETSNDEKQKYDFIFTSETIYNPKNYLKLYKVFKEKLKTNGIGFVAGKTYYFGIGGGMRQFEELVLREGFFDIKIVWKSSEGLQREILKLERKL